MVLLLPPKAFIKSLVKTESLYGTLTLLPAELSANAEITLPSDVNDKLIAAPSFSLSPVAPVAFALVIFIKLILNGEDYIYRKFHYLSLPAKSTKFIIDDLAISLPPSFLYFCTKLIVTIV